MVTAGVRYECTDVLELAVLVLAAFLAAVLALPIGKHQSACADVCGLFMEDFFAGRVVLFAGAFCAFVLLLLLLFQ